jgi:anhydro-N-acetylmuramic acid kinase
MSGTSVDGIDAGLIDFTDNRIRLLAFHYQAFPTTLKQQLQQISLPNQPVFLEQLGRLDAQLGALFASAVQTLLEKAQIPATAVAAIGSHGQTIYHAPEGEFGFSLQIGDPNRIAQLTGVTTVCDFRRRDIAAGGQGAPLVPAFHQAAFAETDKVITVVNIGGIANISIIAGETVSGFDTGPGNTLLDYWCTLNTGKQYDADGNWAGSGQVVPELLQHLLDDPYFSLLPPKSTGKEYFSPAWLELKLSSFTHCTAEDIQATLCRLTADSIADCIIEHAADSQRILLCGGGVHNKLLVDVLQARLPLPLASTAEYGIDPDHVEAIAFAWLARQTMNLRPGNIIGATGANAPVILGGIYPGQPLS